MASYCDADGMEGESGGMQELAINEVKGTTL